MRHFWKQYERRLRYAAVAVIAGLCLWNANSLVTGEIGTMFVPREIHEDYYRYREYINGQEEYFRVLSVPVPSKWMVYTNLHPKAALVDLVRGSWDEFSLPAVDGHPEKHERKWLSPLEQDFSDALLDRSAMKYVAVPRDDPENADDFFESYGKRDVFLAHLQELAYLERIDAGTGDVALFQNAGARPHWYATYEPETMENAHRVEIMPVVFRAANPSEYQVVSREMNKGNRVPETEEVYVHFAEAYHPDWNLYVGEVSWRDVFLGGIEAEPGIRHIENDVGLNTFVLSGSVAERFARGEAFTAFFRPQAYLYAGLWISGAALAVCIVFLGVSIWKNWRKHASMKTI